MSPNRLWSAAFVALSFTQACAHDGTLVSFNTRATEVVRASDQQVLADAIDQAFAKLDVAALRARLRSANATTA